MIRPCTRRSRNKCCIAAYVQQARPHARRRLLAVGHRAQARTLREARSDGLRSALPRRRATRHPLDVHRIRVVAYGVLLCDGPYGLTSPLRISSFARAYRTPSIARFHLGRTVCLISGGNRPVKKYRPLVLSLLASLPSFAQVILCPSHLLSLLHFLLSVPSFLSSQCYDNGLWA